MSQRNFRRELEILSRLSHPNIIQFLGSTNIGEPCRFQRCILLELMPLGDLRNFLISKEGQLSQPTLKHLALDVATGMIYVSSLQLVHRDLSARNCLLLLSDLAALRQQFVYFPIETTLFF